MFTIDVQFQDYVRGVRSSGPGAVVLAERLKKEAPRDLKADEKAALAFVDHCAEGVRLVQAGRDRVSPGKLRPVLAVFMNDWTAFYEALGAKARVSLHVSDVGPKALALSTSLFPDGVSFTQLPARLAWAEGFRRLERVQVEKLEKEIAGLIGPEFLAGAEASTGALGDAIGTGEAPHPGSGSTALSEALGTFGRAVGTYARVLAAHCDESNSDSVQRFLSAVAPLDEHRAIMRATSPAVVTPTATDQEVTAPASAPTQSSVGTIASPAPAPTQSSVGTISSPTSAAPNGASNGISHVA